MTGYEPPKQLETPTSELIFRVVRGRVIPMKRRQKVEVAKAALQVGTGVGVGAAGVHGAIELGKRHFQHSAKLAKLRKGSAAFKAAKWNANVFKYGYKAAAFSSAYAGSMGASYGFERAAKALGANKRQKERAGLVGAGFGASAVGGYLFHKTGRAATAGEGFMKYASSLGPVYSLVHGALDSYRRLR